MYFSTHSAGVIAVDHAQRFDIGVVRNLEERKKNKQTNNITLHPNWQYLCERYYETTSSSFPAFTKMAVGYHKTLSPMPMSS